MLASETRNPQTAANSLRAKIKNSKDIVTEIAGCLLTALLWGWITAQAVIGMIETRVITNETVLAAVGVDDHASR
jgi:hypothetical protein